MRRQIPGGARRVPQFPSEDPKKKVGVNIRLPKYLWKRLDEIAETEGKSRNYVIEFFLEWAADDYATGRRTKK